MILLKRIQLNNFLSHKQTTIDFTSNSRLLIDGKSGAGKSSIVEAITWALFNRGRVQSRSLIKRGETDAMVELELTDENGSDVKIVRKINTRGTHTVNVFSDGLPVPVSGTKNIQEYIETKLIKCSYTLFINSVCYPQENLESFVRQTPANRKDLILELVRAQVYDEYYEKTKTVTGDTKTALTNIEAKITQLLPDIEKARQATADLSRLQAEETLAREELEIKSKELESVTEQYLTQHAIETQITSIETDLTRMRTEVVRQQGLQTQYKQKIAALSLLDADILTSGHIEYLDIIKKLQELNDWENRLNDIKLHPPIGTNYSSIIESLTKEIADEKATAQIIPDEQCDKCGETHECNVIAAERTRSLNTKEEKLAGYVKVQSEYVASQEEFQKRVAAFEATRPPYDKILLLARYTELEAKEKDYVKLESQEELRKQYTEESEALAKTIEELTILGKARVAEVTALKQKLDIDGLQSKKAILSKEVADLNTKLHDIVFYRGSTESVAKNLDIYIKELEESRLVKEELQSKLENLSLLKDAFGQNGIKAVVVDYVIPQLEDRMNSILDQLSSFRIHLDTQKSSVGGDSTIEGLFIGIINDQGEEFDYDSYSGGQKTKITFAISEGLAELQRMGFRILDEAVIGLDEETGQQFAETVIALQDRFPQMLCVSHVREIKDLFTDVVTCVNTNGDSTII